uniref:Sodium-dependent serotonin transporter n=1 Tax=Plectus sambesii TaxID=2011161 RepID=A0A914XL90_9BILA
MPYVVLFILLIRGVTLPGAAKGVWYYITPDFARLKDTTVWIDAATQIFFSLGPGFGVLLALSSYNEFNNNCYHDALITSAINCLTSFLSGFVIFSTLGYMSELTNRDISEVAGDGGPGLIFVVYPQAISTMSYSPVWSVLFFFMLITLGIDSTFGGLEAIITGFCDEYPKLFGRKRELFVLALVIMYFLGSLSTITYGGQYVIEFLDIYGVSFSILFIVVIETTAVCWFYGVRRFSEDVRQMIGYYPSLFWRSCWFFCPIFISVIFLVALYNASFEQMTLDGYTYPVWSVALGWFLRLTSIVCIPLYVCYKLWSLPGTMSERIMAAVKPASRRRSYMIPASAVASVADPDPTSYHTLNSGGAVVAPL